MCCRIFNCFKSKKIHQDPSSEPIKVVKDLDHWNYDKNCGKFYLFVQN